MRFRKLQQLVADGKWEGHCYAYDHPDGRASFRYNTLVWGRIGSDYNGILRKTGTQLEDVHTDQPGLHTLRVWQREDGLLLDRIVLSTNGGYNPSGNGLAENNRSTTLTP